MLVSLAKLAEPCPIEDHSRTAGQQSTTTEAGHARPATVMLLPGRRGTRLIRTSKGRMQTSHKMEAAETVLHPGTATNKMADAGTMTVISVGDQLSPAPTRLPLIGRIITITITAVITTTITVITITAIGTMRANGMSPDRTTQTLPSNAGSYIRSLKRHIISQTLI